MTREKAKKYFHTLADTIEKYGAKKVVKANNYFFWNDSNSKKKALEVLKDYYDGEKAYADEAFKGHREQYDYSVSWLLELRSDDVKKIESADENDVIFINLEEASWQTGVVAIMDYKMALRALDVK